MTLRTAANLAFKNNAKRACASFCRRCLELGPKADVSANLRKMLVVAERENTNAFELNYDEHNPFVICSRSFVGYLDSSNKSDILRFQSIEESRKIAVLSVVPLICRSSVEIYVMFVK